jgi:hypothetical protein
MLSCFNVSYNSPLDIILKGLFNYIIFFYKSIFSNKILTCSTPSFILANLITLFYFCYIQMVLFSFFFLPWPLMCKGIKCDNMVGIKHVFPDSHIPWINKQFCEWQFILLLQVKEWHVIKFCTKLLVSILNILSYILVYTLDVDEINKSSGW